MRLIDADGLIENIEQMKKYQIDVDDVLEILDNTPTIEAAPVVHGKYTMFSANLLSCSVCGDVIQLTEKSNFCPNCGADMRTKEN